MSYDLYVVTDERLSNGLGHVEVARRALQGGADVIQLRDKEMCARDLYHIAVQIRELTWAAGALFIVNDRLDIALAAEADGVHLGQSDLPLEAVRMLVPPWFVIGVSASTLEEGVQAAQGGAHYIGLGPIFATNSKTDAAPACGLEMVRDLHRSTKVPIVAIGGISLANVGEVIRAGADGVAVISAVVGQSDVSGAAEGMKERIKAAKNALVSNADI